MCNTYSFQSIQNHCKETHKSWNWNDRNDEEASTYHKETKWILFKKKVDWCQTRWGYSKALLSWENQLWVTATSCHTQNSISCEIHQSWQNTKNVKDLWVTLRKLMLRKFEKMWLLTIFMIK